VPKALADLQRALVDGCRAAGFPIEQRAFRPHVTLVRSDVPRSPARPPPHRAHRPDRAPAGPPVAWRVRDFVLVSSEPARGGSIYATVASWALQ
jgi:RNA 2',3'-cyclic 3'-phosphodiesterase